MLDTSRSTALIIRTNVLLYSAAVLAAVSVGMFIGIFHEQSGGLLAPPTLQVLILIVSAMLTGVLRHIARRAFQGALSSGKTRVIRYPHREAWIARECPQGWLVQLHLELHGYDCEIL